MVLGTEPTAWASIRWSLATDVPTTGECPSSNKSLREHYFIAEDWYGANQIDAIASGELTARL